MTIQSSKAVIYIIPNTKLHNNCYIQNKILTLVTRIFYTPYIVLEMSHSVLLVAIIAPNDKLLRR
jgi:hypothetical protein